ncbi:hypothetical protein P692DRAFT_201863675 [Suillus brevipes Sb2]|nr:hypothetical protein P692DRAFT_201863675 [Suillus brevipes Sb2]
MIALNAVTPCLFWYRRSALTIVYLSDVPPSPKPGALAKSAWNARGWTFQEFLAPKIVLFYQKDWARSYLGNRSPNHKNSVAIMQEMGAATGIDASALRVVAFHPGMRVGMWLNLDNTVPTHQRILQECGD